MWHPLSVCSRLRAPPPHVHAARSCNVNDATLHDGVGAVARSGAKPHHTRCETPSRICPLRGWGWSSGVGGRVVHCLHGRTFDHASGSCCSHTKSGGRAEGSLWVGCTGCEGASTGPFAAVAETVGPVAGHPHAEAMEAKIHLPL